MEINRNNPIYKHIYKTPCNTYSIDKSINGERIHFKTCKTLPEAIRYRNKLRDNNWEPLTETSEEKQERLTREYYKHIQIASHRYYNIRTSKDDYLGMTKTIEEALYFRDLYADKPKNEVPRVRDVDLITDNPYLKDGLKYPLPDRLILPERNSTYGTGSIVKKGRTSFHIYHGKDKSKNGAHHKYICACPTLEMAEYVRAEMNKVDWDRSKLQDILDDYPKYYTDLLFFYQYIHKQVNPRTKEWTGQYTLTPPKEYNDGKLEHIIYSNLEDALYERDFLKEHDWDYDLLVEVIDDSKNPYYSMDLPTYPTRRIRNVSDRDYHEEELSEVIELMRLGFTQTEVCERLDILPPTLRNWLKNQWGSNFDEFKRIVEAGENPLEVLERRECVFQPDLSRALPNNWNNWVSYLQRSNKWQVRKGTEHFGIYPSEELAHKISKELQKVDWDKSKLKQIQAKYGHVSLPGSKKWVYNCGRKYCVRRKGKDKKMITYGSWHDRRIAVVARDMYIKYGFSLDNRDWINEDAEWIVEMQDLCINTMFGRGTLEDIIYIEDSAKEQMKYIRPTSNKKYQIVKGNVAYGTYDSKEKAMEVRGFLMDNGWDKELLNIMKELGEI